MTMSSSRCGICRGTGAHGTTTFTTDLGFGVLVIRDVPAIVCGQCGEAWFEDAIAARLENVVDDARNRQAVVEVMTWPQIAA
jgi:YgiT-type zinc finger domain-containing protein